MAVHCFSSAQVCAIRASRLSTSCEHVAGATGAVATSAIIRMQSSPEYSQGADFELKDGCGRIAVALRDCDQLKRMNLQLEVCTRDPALVELLTGATLITDGSDTIGFSRRGIGAACPAPASIEIWTKTASVNNNCPPVAVGDYADAKWWRVIWPKATFTLGDVSFANEVATMMFTGYAENNPNFTNGPFNDVPAGVTLDTASPEHMFLDAAGPPALACGYITVPSQA